MDTFHYNERVSADWPIAWPAEWRRSKSIDKSGFTECVLDRIPPGVTLVKGEPAGIRSQGDGASAGPTGAAWVDSNGWRIRLSRMQHPGQTIWVQTETPKAGEIVPAERYLIGVADAAAHGGKWVIAPDPALRKAVASGKQDAVRDWKRIGAAVRFFTAHADWPSLGARSMLGVLSDFTGDNEFLATEILNLAARQQIAYRLLDKAKFDVVPAGFRAIVYADPQTPGAAVRDALARFVEGGGLLITSKVWGKVEGEALPDSPTIRFRLYPMGQGRIAIGDDVSDPYLVAQDAQLLLSHRYDPIRIWNPGSLGTYVTGDGKRTVLHLVNYSGRTGRDALSVKVMGNYSKAALFGLEAARPVELKVLRQRDGVELHLPPVAVYAAVECS
jgi:hypothetical protein